MIEGRGCGEISQWKREKSLFLNKQSYSVFSIKIHNSLEVDMFCNSVFFRF